MPIEDSHDTQHHTPRRGSSRRKPLADTNLQAEVELLRAIVTKMSEKYEHLYTKNIELDMTTAHRSVTRRGLRPRAPNVTLPRMLSIPSQINRCTPTIVPQSSLGSARVKAPSIQR
ncbi:unnamed protein product [Prunus armeniaca]